MSFHIKRHFRKVWLGPRKILNKFLKMYPSMKMYEASYHLLEMIRQAFLNLHKASHPPTSRYSE